MLSKTSSRSRSVALAFAIGVLTLAQAAPATADIPAPSSAEFDRWLADMASDFPLDHTPAIPVGAS